MASSLKGSTSKATPDQVAAAANARAAKAAKAKAGSKATKGTSSKAATSTMKNEIANEFGVKLGADSTARQNGQVGGEITRRLVKMAKTKMGSNK